MGLSNCTLPPADSLRKTSKNDSVPLDLVIVCVRLPPWNFTVRLLCVNVPLSAKLPNRFKSPPAKSESFSVLPLAMVESFWMVNWCVAAESKYVWPPSRFKNPYERLSEENAEAAKNDA